MTFRRDKGHGGSGFGGKFVVGEKPVAFADEQIANVESDGDAVFGVQCFFAVTDGVVVFDVVVNQRGFVESFDGHGDFFEVGRKFFAVLPRERLVSGDGEKRPPAFAGAHEPVGADAFAIGLRIAKERGERDRCEPGINFFAQGGEIESARGVGAAEVNVIPHPIQIDVGIDAIVLKQRNRDAGNGSGFHIRKCALEHAETTDTDDGFDFAGLNQAHDDGGTFGDEHGVTEFFGLKRHVLDGTESALLAQQPEFIEWGRAFAFHAKTFWKKEKTTFVRNSSERFAPHFVVDQYADVIAINRIAAKTFDNAVGVHFQIGGGQRGNGIKFGDVIANGLQDALAMRERLRDVLLGRAPFLDGRQPRDVHRIVQ